MNDRCPFEAVCEPLPKKEEKGTCWDLGHNMTMAIARKETILW